ncbi:MAG: hypothetical protein JXR32_06940 [Anaerolineaceae bacterium]|nr:hypothetical protein [Anaerolineaceae bacterium]
MITKRTCMLLTILLVVMGVFPASRMVNATSWLSPPDPVLVSDQHTNPRFENLTVDDGLSQSTVHAILQDDQGYLWFGTEDGLNRFDGEKFIVFKSDASDPNSLPGSYITALAQAPQGGIWIGTRLGGLSYYDPQTESFTNYLYESTNPDSLDSPRVNCLFVDQDGQLMVGTPYGLNVFQPDSGGFTHIRQSRAVPFSSALNNILTIFRGSNGTLWLGTSNGLVSYNAADNWFTNYFEIDIYAQTPLAREVRRISEDFHEGLWLAGSMGVTHFEFTTGRFTFFQHDEADPASLSDQNAYDLLVDLNGSVWIGTKNGLNRYEQTTNKFQRFTRDPQNPFSLSSEVILSLYEDREGILWMGTFGGGVNKLDRNKAKFDLFQYNSDDPNSLSPFPIFGVTEGRDGSIWLATYGGGLDRLDRNTGRVIHYRNIPGDDGSLIDDYVWSVYEDRDGFLWVGSEGGLDRLDPDTGLFSHFVPDANNPRALGGAVIGQIYEDHAGELWIATSGGLSRFYRDTNLFNSYAPELEDPDSFNSHQPTAIFETRESELWIGTYDRGLELYLRNEDRFRHFRHDILDPWSLSGDSICAIHQDIHGYLWIGTCTSGLNRMDVESGKFTHFTEEDGLPSSVILGIVEDEDGNLWLSTNDGVSYFNVSEGSFTNFDFSDGLQSDEFGKFSYAKTRDGSILFGGIAGLNIFQPDEISDNPYIPPIVLTGISQSGELIDPDQYTNGRASYTIRWPNNYFNFEYAALSYSNPLENQYAFKLEPFDRDWIDMGNRRFGRYTNLPGGNYTLRIKGSNNDGVWNETGLIISIIVIPPFWNNAWFQLITILLFGLLVFAGYRWRLRNIRSYNRDLELQVQERTAEIERLFQKTKELAVVEERNRLARDLHDSVKQKAFAALAQLATVKSIMKKDQKNARIHLDEAETLVSEVIEELTFLIQEMYPMVLKEKGLVSVLRSYLFEWQNRNNIPVNVQIHNERRVDLQVEQALFRIIQESLSNVARHSGAQKVDLSLEFAKRWIELSIQDDGCGFDTSVTASGIGQQTMQERARLIHGQLKLNTTPGQGTSVILKVPMSGYNL